MQETEEALVVRVLGACNSGSYEIDEPEEVYEHIRMAKEKLETDPAMVDTCFLTPKDTVNIFDHGHTIRVLRPQGYDAVSALDAADFMFERCRDERDGCRGLFYAFNGKAVSGSGADVWYKFSHALVKFCRELDNEVASFWSPSDDPELFHLKSDFEGCLERSGTLSEEARRHETIAAALRKSKDAALEDAFQIRQKMGAVLARSKRKREVP